MKRVLSRLCFIMVLMMLPQIVQAAPSAPKYTDGYRIYFLDTSGYGDNLGLYAWHKDEQQVVTELFGGWPGVAPNGKDVVNDKTCKYFYTGSENKGKTFSLIFNSGTAQLPDFEVTLNRDYYLKIEGGKIVEETHINTTEYSPTEMYVLYSLGADNWNFGKVKMYAGSFRGKEYFEFTFPEILNGQKLYFFLLADPPEGFLDNGPASDGAAWTALKSYNKSYSCTFGADEDITYLTGTKECFRGSTDYSMCISKPGVHTVALDKTGRFTDKGNEILEMSYTTADYNPSPKYIIYDTAYGDGDWQLDVLTATTDGNSWSYTLPNADKVRFLILSDLAEYGKLYNEDGTFNWDYLQGNGDYGDIWIRYIPTEYTADGSVRDITDYSGSALSHGKGLTTAMQLKKAGAQTITLTKNPRNINDVTFTYTTTGEKVDGMNLFLGYHVNGGEDGTDENWKHGQVFTYNPTTHTYSFIIKNTKKDHQAFYISNEAGETFPGSRFVLTGDNNVVTGTPAELVFDPNDTHTNLVVNNAKNQRVTIYAKIDNTGKMTVWATKQAHSSDYNLPLTRADFYKGDGETGDIQPHYFLVGTRMADWRLQPEWELKDMGTDADGNPVYGIKNRIMYTGLISVAKVDYYTAFAMSRYVRYMSPVSGGSNFSFNKKSSDLVNVGDFAYYGTVNNKKPDGNYINKDNADRFFCHTSRMTWGENAIQNSTGILCEYIKVTVDKTTGEPVKIEFDMGSGTEAAAQAAINKYITFSFVGEGVKNETLIASNGISTPRGGTTWQEAWLQYDDETGLPLTDAMGNNYYQTVFQNDWLNKTPTYFSKNLPGGRTFDYSSESILMRNVKSMDDDELAEDEYAEYYTRFNDTAYRTIGGNGNVVIGDKYDFTEYLKDHTKDGTTTDQTRTAAGNWECFVVKDMWMDGTFKIWTGWGGGTKDREYSSNANNDSDAARWYYANCGHGHANCKGSDEGSRIHGYDILRKNSEVGMFATHQDVYLADFSLDKLTYFKRVIVWYDPVLGFDNSAIQLIIERFGPAIQAARGTLGNAIEYTWNIPEDDYEPYTDEEKALPVKKYVITRYEYNEDAETETAEWAVSGTPMEFDLSGQDKTIGDFLSEQTGLDENLVGGVYRYKIDITYTDGTGTDVSRYAWSNQVVLFDASQPVEAKVSQVTEGRNANKKYSFDLKLDLDLSAYAYDLVGLVGDDNNPTEIDLGDICRGYYVYIKDAGVANDLMQATAASVICHNGVTNIGKEAQNPLRQITGTGLKVYDFSRQREEIYTYLTEGYYYWIPFKASNYDEANDPTLDDNNGEFRAIDHAKKTLLWENIIKGSPDRKYGFEIYLRPREGTVTINGETVTNIEQIFADFNLMHTYTECDFYIPGADIAFLEPEVGVEELEGETELTLMPNGAVYNGEAHAPAHYTRANTLNAVFKVNAPAVTDKVKENFDIDYTEGTGAEAPILELEKYTLSGNAIDCIKHKYLDVTSLFTGNGDKSGSKIPVSETVGVRYSRAGSSVAPQTVSEATGNVELDALTKPVMNIGKATVTSFEEVAKDEKRYYVNDLHANLEITNKPNYVAYPGIRISRLGATRTVDFDNTTFTKVENGVEVEYTDPLQTTAHAAANGGVIAHKSYFKRSDDLSYLDDHFDWLAGYELYESGEYDHSIHNWSEIARNGIAAIGADDANVSVDKVSLPVLATYFGVVEKTDETEASSAYKRTLEYEAELTFHYPFLIASTPAARVSSRASLRKVTPGADGAPVLVTLPAVHTVNSSILAENVPTAISDVEADEDWSDAEFYNLQGIRVAEPQPGQVYLVRRSGEVTKLLYR